ncbi:MAG TPA: hypothetical protein VM118_03625 [Acidobacteriota bacterium]|nr:hypothetical protein [Acidobacteriota bacterium]
MRRLSHIAIGLAAAIVINGNAANRCAAQTDVGAAVLTGIGGAYGALVSEPLTIWYNPALTALDDTRGGVSLSYRHLFEMSDLEEITVGVVRHFRRPVTVGLGVTHLGEASVYEEFVGLTTIAVRPHTSASLGAGLRYRRTEFGDGAAAYAGATLDLGGAWRADTNWIAAVAVREITLDDLYRVGDPPTVYDISLAWMLPPDLTVAGRWSKESGGESRFGVGQLLRINDQATFLSGLRFDPIRYALGARLTRQTLRIDYCYESHPDLGGTHAVGMSWWW